MAKKNGSKHPPADAAASSAARTALLYQLLETELGGVQVYRTALLCAIHPELRTEWTKYLADTERHVIIARDLLSTLGHDPDAEIPERMVVRHMADGLVTVMHEALAAGSPEAAQLTAAECVISAETKDHQNWSLLGLLIDGTDGAAAEAMRAAHALVETEEDVHLYHTAGWVRELWAHALGLPAALPPPEEQRKVESAMSAARAKADRRQMT